MRNSEQDASFGFPAVRGVPRISIRAFCEFPDTGAALQRAGGDRRLSKAQLTVQLGGIKAAVEFFAGQVTPNLLIVETRLSGQAALDELDHLAEVCDPATKVIVIGRVNDVELYRALMRRGASDYLVAPLDPMRLIDVIANLYADPDGAPVGRTIAFFSARGGAGSSTLAHNVGWCIAEELRIATALVDFDLSFGTLGLNYDDDPGQGVFDALQAPERLDDTLLDRLLVKRSDTLSLFTAPVQLDQASEVAFDAYESVIEAMRRASPCVILDLPHAWEPWMRAALIGADEIVITAAPDLASLRNAKNLIEYLRQNRPNDAAPLLVLNQVGMPKRPEIPLKDFAATIGFAPTCVLPFDPSAFGAAANSGRMVPEMNPKMPVSGHIRELSRRLAGQQKQTADSASPSLLSLWKGRKRA